MGIRWRDTTTSRETGRAYPLPVSVTSGGTGGGGMESGVTVVSYGYAVINAATNGDNTVVAAQAAGQRIRVLSYVLVAAGTVSPTWKSGAATPLSGAMPLVANTGISSGHNPLGHFQTAAATALVLNLSAAVQVSGHLHYAVCVVA